MRRHRLDREVWLRPGDSITVEAHLTLINDTERSVTVNAIDWRVATVEDFEPAGIDRHDLLSVVMTRQEWDAAVGARYPDDHGAQARLRDLVGAGREHRLAAARAEFDARMPKLTDRVKAEIAAEARRLVAARNSGTLDVDHLGCPFKTFDGFAISCTPHLATSGAALQFSFAETPHFDGKAYPLRDEDRAWFIDLAREITGQDDGSVWNQGGPYVNVQWQPTTHQNRR